MTNVTSPSAQIFTALVLAADRGPDDPVARAGGMACKSLVPVAGIPMLERVIGALEASPWVDKIAVSLRDTDLLAEHERRRGKPGRVIDPAHFEPVLDRKPQARVFISRHAPFSG